ncbi:TonB-dependent siderophore receptor [Glaciimonas soli]|uniref:TonB-dependent siderophore receptor n=1 Tax=Glaciimonas soli TaxID=2590999 RepID=A0A843YIE4_9BURK|nr:TonB-dependent siderophore receptor [Glaciimonas soli]MQQ99124.1 TonB-dependent siderophore receptor [Glaciimonas soli]
MKNKKHNKTQRKTQQLLTLLFVAGTAAASSYAEDANMTGSAPDTVTSANGNVAATPEQHRTLPIVTVTGSAPIRGSYGATSSAVSSFGDTPLLDTPASISVMTRNLMNDQQSRLLTDVTKNDASIDDNYAPLGYYENVSIRGFPLDLASSYQLDGMTISGEQNVALENKERVEVLKGLAGLQTGMGAAGGLINYVSKRPADVRSITLGTDSRGSRYLAADIGTIFGDQNQFGIRVNAAHEGINTYVHGADGNRNFGSLAADWKISPSAKLEFNIEDQHRQQRSVPGYQLLGGTTLPTNVSPSTLLGGQSWAKPVTIDALNTNLRLDVDLNADWHTYLMASRSKVVIDDNVAFPYGCYYVTSCINGDSPGQYFSPSGEYDIYDYRFPKDTRINDQVQAVLQGKFSTAQIVHDLTVGVSSFRRYIAQTDGVSEYVGSDNIYNPNPIAFPPSPDQPGAFYKRLDSRQQGLFAVDRISLSDSWQVVAGARQVWLREQAFDITGAATRTTDKSLLLPQVALLFKPQAAMTLYTSYSKGLTMGGQAPAWADNANIFLAPTVSRQIEAGIKYDVSSKLMITGALFQMTKPYEYPKPDGAGGFEYVQEGTQTNRGLELSAAGQASSQLRLTASISAIQAIANDTGTASYDGHQAINVPRIKATVYADYAIQQIAGLSLLGGWEYSASKAATREGNVDIPAYYLFNAGSRYTTTLAGHNVVLRLSIDNLLNKQYWKDSGEFLGDSYIHLGAPRTARLSMQYDF